MTITHSSPFFSIDRDHSKPSPGCHLGRCQTPRGIIFLREHFNKELMEGLPELTLKDEGLRYLSPKFFANFSALTSLNLSRNKLERLPTPELLEWAPKLKILDLSYNHLQDIEDIRKLGFSKTLEELSIEGNPLPHVSQRIYLLESIMVSQHTKFEEAIKKRLESLLFLREQQGIHVDIEEDDFIQMLDVSAIEAHTPVKRVNGFSPVKKGSSSNLLTPLNNSKLNATAADGDTTKAKCQSNGDCGSPQYSESKYVRPLTAKKRKAMSQSRVMAETSKTSRRDPRLLSSEAPGIRNFLGVTDESAKDKSPVSLSKKLSEDIGEPVFFSNMNPAPVPRKGPFPMLQKLEGKVITREDLDLAEQEFHDKQNSSITHVSAVDKYGLPVERFENKRGLASATPKEKSKYKAAFLAHDSVQRKQKQREQEIEEVRLAKRLREIIRYGKVDDNSDNDESIGSASDGDSEPEDHSILVDLSVGKYGERAHMSHMDSTLSAMLPRLDFESPESPNLRFARQTSTMSDTLEGIRHIGRLTFSPSPARDPVAIEEEAHKQEEEEEEAVFNTSANFVESQITLDHSRELFQAADKNLELDERKVHAYMPGLDTFRKMPKYEEVKELTKADPETGVRSLKPPKKTVLKDWKVPEVDVSILLTGMQVDSMSNRSKILKKKRPKTAVFRPSGIPEMLEKTSLDGLQKAVRKISIQNDIDFSPYVPKGYSIDSERMVKNIIERDKKYWAEEGRRLELMAHHERLEKIKGRKYASYNMTHKINPLRAQLEKEKKKLEKLKNSKHKDHMETNELRKRLEKINLSKPVKIEKTYAEREAEGIAQVEKEKLKEAEALAQRQWKEKSLDVSSIQKMSHHEMLLQAATIMKGSSETIRALNKAQTDFHRNEQEYEKRRHDPNYLMREWIEKHYPFTSEENGLCQIGQEFFSYSEEFASLAVRKKSWEKRLDDVKRMEAKRAAMANQQKNDGNLGILQQHLTKANSLAHTGEVTTAADKSHEQEFRAKLLEKVRPKEALKKSNSSRAAEKVKAGLRTNVQVMVMKDSHENIGNILNANSPAQSRTRNAFSPSTSANSTPRSTVSPSF